MTFFRKMVRKSSQELQQIYKRFEEKKRRQSQLSLQISSTKAYAFNARRNGLLVQSSDHRITKQFLSIKFQGFTYDLNKRNNCCISFDDNVYILRNILYVNDTNNYYLKVQKFQEVDSLYNVDDLDSRRIGIFKCSKLSEGSIEIPLKEIKCKAFKMPFWRNNERFFEEGIYVIAQLFEEQWLLN